MNEHVLENESVQVGELLDRRTRGLLEVLLFKLASNRVLVAEDEVNLVMFKSIHYWNA